MILGHRFWLEIVNDSVNSISPVIQDVRFFRQGVLGLHGEKAANHSLHIRSFELWHQEREIRHPGEGGDAVEIREDETNKKPAVMKVSITAVQGGVIINGIIGQVL